MMKPLMMMRAKGVSGPMFAKHYGIPRLSKSAGNFVSGDKELRAIRGYTAGVNCTGDNITTVTVVFSGNVTYTDGSIPITISFDGGSFYIEVVSGNGTNTIEYTGNWDVQPSVGDTVIYEYNSEGGYYKDDEGNDMGPQTVTLTNCSIAPLAVDSYQIIQTETPNGSRIIRSQVIEVKFNQKVTSLSTIGVTATVHGSQQNVVLSGTNTDTLKYTVQRAIFRHAITWAYNSALGDIVATKGGEPLGDISEQIVINLLPSFTVWDYNAGAPDANTDTTWDTDETRFDEEP